MAFILVALCIPSLGPVFADILNLEEGAACTALGGGSGFCTLLSKCRDPGDFRREQPPICKFRGTEPLICCPPALSLSPGAGLRAKQYCKRLNAFCGEENGTATHPAVSADRTSKPRTRKYMAVIGYGPPENKSWACSGSLISQRYILSAAQCANVQDLGAARWARLGLLDAPKAADAVSDQERTIVRRVVHPSFKGPAGGSDIALFRTDSDVLFNARVSPICLQAEGAELAGLHAFLAASSKGKMLLEADLKVYNESGCKNLLQNMSEKSKNETDANLLCAGTKPGNENTCVHDPGGALVINSHTQCERAQVGVASFGQPCTPLAQSVVFTRVSGYISWIEDIVFFTESLHQ